MKYLVVSDFHLGKGKYLANGEVNILEEFNEDERFAEFLDHYSLGSYYLSDIHLVLNGDILNLIQIDIDGIFTHLIDEEDTVQMLKDIVSGHKEFFDGLRKFISRPGKEITYVIGNHDIAMNFPKAQEYLRSIVGKGLQFTERLQVDGISIEHGHRFEPVNTMPKSKYFVKGPKGTDIINLPWGSLFCLYLLPKLKMHRPYIDNIRPLSLYIWWTIIHDFRFFIYLCYTVSKYLIRTQFPPYGKYNKNFKLSFKQIFKISVHPSFIKFAKRIMDKNKNIKVVVLGHSHISEWRRFRNGKYYFNTGTWNHVPSLDESQHKNISNLTYVCIDLNKKGGAFKNAYINSWQGKWRPYIEEVRTSLY